MDFVVGPQSEKKRNRKERQTLGTGQRTKESVGNESNGDTNCSWRVWNGPQRLRKRAKRVGNRRMDQYHSKNSIVKIGHNLGNLRRLAVTQWNSISLCEELTKRYDNNNIPLVYRNGNWYWKMCHANNETGEKRNNGSNRTTKSVKHQNSWRKKLHKYSFLFTHS